MKTSAEGPVPAPAPAAARATIDDVARAAAVSRQTVSNVVRGRGRFSSATRDRVLTAIDQLGYQPHTGAASLRSGRTHRIAYPVPGAELRIDNTIMLEFLEVLVDATRQRRHQLLVTSSYGSPVEMIGDLIRTRSVDGFVLATLTEADPRVEFLAERQVPFACFGRTDPPDPQQWVDIDNRAAVRDLTTRVLARGHTDVAFLGYIPNGRWDLERETGYQDAMTAASLPATVTRTAMAPAETEAAVAALLRPPGRPTAVIAGSDILAAACYAAAARIGLRIGPDLAVTGFDGTAISRLIVPALTTVTLPLAQIASRLVDRVIAQVAGVPHDHGEILGTTVTWGQSV